MRATERALYEALKRVLLIAEDCDELGISTAAAIRRDAEILQIVRAALAKAEGAGGTNEAPAGTFRVVAVDTFDGQPHIEGDFDNMADAIGAARTRAGTMTKMYVYDSTGKRIAQFGQF